MEPLSRDLSRPKPGSVLANLPRVVGSPQHGRLFGAKSREALSDQEQRRSGHFSPPPRTPTPPPEPVLPKVIYVPLPAPPRVSTEDYWAHRLARPDDEARRLCGLPALSPALSQPAQPWPGTVPVQPASDRTETTDDSLRSTATGSTPSRERSPGFWRRLAALFCLSRG